MEQQLRIAEATIPRELKLGKQTDEHLDITGRRNWPAANFLRIKGFTTSVIAA